MNVFEYCMKMEEDGKAYYLDLEAKCKIPGLKKVLRMLAEDEVEHYNIFKSLRDNDQYKAGNSTILADSKNVFQKMKGNSQGFDLEGSSVELFKKAIEVENESEKFYKEKAAEVENEEAKKLLLKIAEEEKTHSHLLTNVVEFLSRPDSWIENAEFNHLESY